jgi:hypothetical protein
MPINVLMNSQAKTLINKNLIFICAICAFSFAFEWYNHVYTQFSGIIYVPVQSISLLVVLVLIHFGLKLSWQDKYPYFSNLTFYLGFFVLVLWTLAQLTNAVQLTPFKIIDPLLYQADLLLHLDMVDFMQQANHFPSFKTLMQYSYASLNHQVLFIPLLLIVLKQYDHFLKTCLLFLITSFIGFNLYYFFPSTGPATLLKLPIFSPGQFATGIKFQEIHQRQLASTIEGGLIAFPSFHVTWALVCQYACQKVEIPGLYWFLMVVNTLLILACPLLGWHYFIDVFAAFLLFFSVLYFCNRVLF